MHPAAQQALVLGIFAACTPQHVSKKPAVEPSSVGEPVQAGPTARRFEESPELSHPIVLIDDPQTLASLGLGFGPTVLDADATDTLGLRASRRFRELAPRVLDFATPRWWLRSPRTELQLAAVVNRLDRRDILPGTCGETRLVYRLVHRTTSGETRMLPAALNVLFVQQDRDDRCRSAARSWQVEDAGALRAEGGPLSDVALSFRNVRAIESNVQGDFRGRPRNVLEIHLPTHDPGEGQPQWTTGALEFSPDTGYKGGRWQEVTALLTDPAMRAAIAEGTATMGERGVRTADWDSTLRDSFAGARAVFPEDGDYSPFADKAAFLKRARSLTCGGCHATRAVDGFHVSAGTSAHLSDETLWRTAYVTAVAEGREPNRVRLSVDGGR